jgi:hypothetical protein
MPLSVGEQNEQLSRRLAVALEDLSRLSARVRELEAQRQFHLFRHDCMNLIGSMRGFLALLQDSQSGVLNSRQQRYVQCVEKSTQSLLMLIEKTSLSNSPESNSREPNSCGEVKPAPLSKSKRK